MEEGAVAMASSTVGSASPKPIAKTITPAAFAPAATCSAAASVPTVERPSVSSRVTLVAAARVPAPDVTTVRASESASAMFVSGPWSPRGTSTALKLDVSGCMSWTVVPNAMSATRVCALKLVTKPASAAVICPVTLTTDAELSTTSATSSSAVQEADDEDGVHPGKAGGAGGDCAVAQETA